MRDTIVDYIKGLNLGTFSFSEEYPRSESNQPLYIKNQKMLYADTENYNEEALVQTLNNLQIMQQTTSVTVYFSVDGKRVPNNYVGLVNLLRAGRDLGDTLGYHISTAEVETDYVQDLLVTEITYNFTNVN